MTGFIDWIVERFAKVPTTMHPQYRPYQIYDDVNNDQWTGEKEIPGYVLVEDDYSGRHYHIRDTLPTPTHARVV